MEELLLTRAPVRFSSFTRMIYCSDMYRIWAAFEENESSLRMTIATSSTFIMIGARFEGIRARGLLMESSQALPGDA